jgi:hypothetical protein
MAPSSVALSGTNNRISSVAATKSGEPDLSHDNSGGNPGVLIYTNNKDTYNRYTTTQSKYGQLASAKVIYVGSPDSSNNAFLVTDNPVNVSPSANDVTYGNRVTINPGESWYYYSPEDADTKAEERGFITISSLIPSMVGFSPTAAAESGAADAISKALSEQISTMTGGEKVTVYRVEGLPNTRLVIGDHGQVMVLGDRTLFLNFGDKARALEFLAKRVQQNMPGAAVKSFEVPQSFLTDLRNAAVTRAEVRDHPESPILVDVTKAKDQFGLRPDQIEALRKTIIQNSGKVH